MLFDDEGAQFGGSGDPGGATTSGACSNNDYGWACASHRLGSCLDFA